MSGSSEKELQRLVASLHIPNIGFMGIYDCRFPGFISKHRKQCAIVNTGPRESGGYHWIAFAWDPTSYKMFMFDPLGWTNDQLKRFYGFSYQNMIKRSALTTTDRCITLERNRHAVQCTCSGSCGLFCVFFLFCFHLQPCNPFGTTLMQQMEGSLPKLVPNTPAHLHCNQSRLYRFLFTHSSYFRNHFEEIVRNTNVGLLNTH